MIKNKTKLTALLASAGLCLSMSVATLAQDDETLARGEQVFNTIAGIGCKGCHGEFAEGDLGVGPYIRGATEGSVRAAISGIDAMVVVRTMIDEQGIKDVSAYMESLGSTRIIRTLAKKGRFLPNSTSVPANSRFQIVVNNVSFQPKTYRSDDLNLDGGKLIVPARTTGTISWVSPQQGEVKIWCEDCAIEDEYFTINVGS